MEQGKANESYTLKFLRIMRSSSAMFSSLTQAMMGAVSQVLDGAAVTTSSIDQILIELKSVRSALDKLIVLLEKFKTEIRTGIVIVENINDDGRVG